MNNGSNFMRDATGQIIIGVKGQQINVENNSSATTMYPNFFTRGNEYKAKIGDYNNGLSTRSATTLDLNLPSYNRNMHVSLSVATSSIDFSDKLKNSQTNFLPVPQSNTFLQSDFSKTKIQTKKQAQSPYLFKENYEGQLFSFNPPTAVNIGQPPSV